jgi:eukaryotic-like serine/threonine-protein kinase
MSRVFIAFDARLGRRVVAKVLPPEFAAEVSIERFRREIQVAAQLRHPHIVPLLDAGEAAGCLFYTMPFIEGESLRQRLERQGALAPDLAVRIAAEAADALQYAHAAGVIHRDIKPENILVDSGHAVVTDFGIARAIRHAGPTLTQTGATIGTLAYMSPEQALGDQNIDARADVYALGCVLFEMLTGEPPLGGLAALRSGRSSTKPGAITAAQIPEPLRISLTRALAPDPADRLESAAAFRDLLLGARSFPARMRRRTFLIAAAVVGVLVAGALLVPGFGLRPGDCDDDTILVMGRVLDAAGKPVPAADVWVPPLAEAALTLADGSFRFRMPNAKPVDEVTVRVRRQGAASVSEWRASLAGCSASTGTIILAAP